MHGNNIELFSASGKAFGMKSICGIWVSPEGEAHLSLRAEDGGRVETTAPFGPFVWSGDEPGTIGGGAEAEALSGPGPYRNLLTFPDFESYRSFVGRAGRTATIDFLRSLESQFLLRNRERLFAEMPFAELRRCQLDIETGCTEPGGFSDARRAGDRVLAIGLRIDGKDRFIELEEDSDEAERKLLKDFAAFLHESDPDTLEGHNIFKFDLDYLRLRAKRLKVPCAWGRFGRDAVFRSSRLKAAERWVDFPRCDIPGRTVVDTYLMILLYDVTTRDLPGYGLKEVAVRLGVTPRDGAGRTYIEGSRIGEMFAGDRERFRNYLADDLRETAGVADILLPTYFAQTRNFPMSLQEVLLRGTSWKIDLLFLEEYFHARQALPEGGEEVKSYEGGFTRSYEVGVFREILHFDVASLYPSLLLSMQRNPQRDSLGVFIPLLQKLREYRMKYKALAREADSADLRTEYEARQAAFKIIINSFYGYLGFPNARFADGDLAAEVTARGRELLQALIEKFAELGCTILEADTDGIYLASEEYFERPGELLEQVKPVLPEGIELEYDGSYESMFCYKSKNYALYDGKKITIRGSALRSRGIEPYLKQLSDALIRYLLGVDAESPAAMAEDYRRRIEAGEVAIEEIARSEILGQSPEAYQKALEGAKKKPRRASLEAALQLEPLPRSGDRVAYYIVRGEKKRMPDWQRARPVEHYDPEANPYDPDYYTRKIDDWLKRYGGFLNHQPAGDSRQSELW